MRVNLAYGEGYRSVDLPDGRTTLIEPTELPGLEDERRAVLAALAQPIGCPPLREWIRPGHRICIVFTDLTRATPNHRLIPWLLEDLADVPRDRITLLNSTGSHRPNTPEELEVMLTPAIARGTRVINHVADDPALLVAVGTTRDGSPALLNRHLVEADVRIITGFIEPHFFAGFSGGPKGIMPGVAGLATIMSNHRAQHIADPQAAFGVTEGNPIWEEMRDIALRPGPSFLLNVTLNSRREITGVFAGDLIEAHRSGVAQVRRSAMQRVSAPFDVVVTTNSGYPLDLNLYQGVKGMCAASRITKPGGTIILAAECREGAPSGSSYARLLEEAKCPERLLTLLQQPGFCRPDQWQAQIQALIQRRANVLVYSTLPDEVVRRAGLAPCREIGLEVNRLLTQLGPNARAAVLPHGPLTIPYVA